MSWWRRRKKGKHVAVQGGVLSNPVIAEATEDLKRSVSRGAEVDKLVAEVRRAWGIHR